MVNTHHVVGTGEHKVVALNGWFGSADGWGPFTGYLDQSAFSYAFLDYRGYGGSRGVPGEYTLEEISADALELVDHLGWDTFSLVGHSMGGAAAARILADAPDRVRKLVGISPVPSTGFPFDEAGWALFDGAADSPENRRTIIDFTTGNRNTGVWLDQMVQHSLSTSDRDAFAAYLVAWGKADFAVEPAGTPVKLIAGQHDPALGEEFVRSAWLSAFPDAEVEVMANAGHYPMFETPVALATSVEKFLGT